MDNFQLEPLMSFTNTTSTNLFISGGNNTGSINIVFWIGCPVYAIGLNLIIAIMCQCFKKLAVAKSEVFKMQEWPNPMEVTGYHEYNRYHPFGCVPIKNVEKSSKSQTCEVNFHAICCSYRIIYSCGKCRLKPPKSEKDITRQIDRRRADRTQNNHNAVHQKQSPDESAVFFNIQRPTNCSVKETVYIGPSSSAAGLFCIQLIALFDILNMMGDYILPLILQSTDVQERIASKTIFVLNCRFRFVIRIFTKIIIEWTLVVFGCERLMSLVRRTSRGSTPTLGEHDRLRWDVLKMKLGMSLFIIIIFAACNNYLLIIGQMFSMKYLNGKDSVRLILICQVRKEFRPFYEHFLKYLELIAFSLLPHFISISLFIIITIVWLVRCSCLRHDVNIRQSNVTIDSLCRVCSGLCTALYCTQVLIRSSLLSPTHLNKIFHIMFNRQIDPASTTLEQNLAMVRLTMSSTSALMFLIAIICQHRKCLRHLNLDHMTSVSSPTDTNIPCVNNIQTDSV